jgi:hypothetical protein
VSWARASRQPVHDLAWRNTLARGLGDLGYPLRLTNKSIARDYGVPYRRRRHRAACGLF